MTLKIVFFTSLHCSIYNICQLWPQYLQSLLCRSSRLGGIFVNLLTVHVTCNCNSRFLLFLCLFSFGCIQIRSFKFAIILLFFRKIKRGQKNIMRFLGMTDYTSYLMFLFEHFKFSSLLFLSHLAIGINPSLTITQHLSSLPIMGKFYHLKLLNWSKKKRKC